MRILAISSYGGLGGAELHLEAFLQHRPDGVRAQVLVLEEGPIAGRLAALGLSVGVAMRQSQRPTPASLARFTRSLERLLASERPDVVWANGQKATLLAAPACRARGVPLVWHKVDFSWDRGLAVPLALAADGVIGVSRAVLASLGPARRRALGIAGVPITLPACAVARPDPARPVIGTLARLVPYKGLHHLVETLALLSEEFPATRLLVAGGPVREYPHYRDELRTLALRLGVADRVELLGFVPDPVAVLGRFTVFVSATHRDPQGFGLEGLGAAALEASWMGLPVVAARGGGTGEAVLDGRTGTLVDGADPVRLASATSRYLRDPALAARVGAAGSAYAREHFAAGVAAERVFGFLERAAARSGGDRQFASDARRPRLTAATQPARARGTDGSTRPRDFFHPD